MKDLKKPTGEIRAASFFLRFTKLFQLDKTTEGAFTEEVFMKKNTGSDSGSAAPQCGFFSIFLPSTFIIPF